MTLRKFLSLSLFGILGLAIFSKGAWALDKPYDHSVWDRFLKEFVNEKGEVDYQGVHEKPQLLKQYLRQLEEIERREFVKWPREEKIALWINAYNASIIQAILEHYPVKSIRDIPGIWDDEFIKVAERPFSLNKIESDILMGAFKDEKIRTALACGGRSCPRLRQEAFTGPRLDGQLFLAAKEFVSDSSRNKIIPGEKKIWLSRILKWHADDFRLDFGVPENDRNLLPDEYAVLSFVSHYLDDNEKIRYLEEGNYKVKYMEFDWSLNKWQKKAVSIPSGSLPSK